MAIAALLVMSQQTIRTGLFRYVRLKDVDTFCRDGWMAVADLGIPHNAWSILMWHCECEEYNPHYGSDKNVLDFPSSIQGSEAKGASHATSDRFQDQSKG